MGGSKEEGSGPGGEICEAPQNAAIEQRSGAAGALGQETQMTPSEQQFLANAAKAARKAGFRDPKQAASKLMKLPQVKAAIEAKKTVMINESGRDWGRRVSVTRNEIINGFHELSQKPYPPSVRISALGHLKDIYGLSAKSNDTDIFAGWTDDELQRYYESGELPPRYGQALGALEREAGNSLPAAPKTD